MAKPGGSSGGGNFKGTAGNDTFHVASLAELKASTYDGAGGVDTLDLSALTTGLTIGLAAEMTYKTSKSQLWPDHAFTGFYTDSFASLNSDTDKIAGSINNIERVIGSSGNDQIGLANNGYGDGGPGNDYVVGGTVIGGLGADYVNGTGAGEILVGGTYVNGVATGDHTTDWFEIDGSSGTILDFELGIDKLVLPGLSSNPTLISSTTWQPATYNGVGSSVLNVNGQTITLVGITPDQANTIRVGQFFGSDSGTTMTGGPGDDIMWPSSTTSQLVFGPGSGNDIVTHFNIAADHLIFNGGAPDSWTQVSVNGEVAIQGIYDNGASSVTILGLSQSDVSHLLIG